MDFDKVIVTDVDGVLLDWFPVFERWMNDKGYVSLKSNEYDIGKKYGIDRAVSKPLVCEFNESHHMKCLPSFRDSVEYVKKLAALGYKFHVVTSQSENPEAAANRVQNLEYLFGKVFDNIVVLGCGEDKDEALEMYRNSGVFWIEDKPENASLGNKMGMKSVLMQHDHNEDYAENGIQMVESWKEIFDMVIEK